jgi:hypothetical protein
MARRSLLFRLLNDVPAGHKNLIVLACFSQRGKQRDTPLLPLPRYYCFLLKKRLTIKAQIVCPHDLRECPYRLKGVCFNISINFN